jgi:opacity protein-like surface antigen
LFCLFFGQAWADISDIGPDAEKLAKWFSQEVAHATAFNAAANPQLPGEVHSLLGVELGLSAGVSSTKVDKDGFNNLPLGYLETDGFDMPSDLMVGMPIIHGKVGLLWDLDLGLKYGRLSWDDTNKDAKSEIENTVWGVELRRRLMGEGVTGVVLPDVALSLAYDQSSGDVTRTEHYNDGNLDANTTLKSEWQTGAVTARVVASKQLVIITPYIGAGYSRLMGDADTTMDVNEVGTSLGVGNVSSKSSAKADDDVLHFLGGMEFTFFPMLKINLGGIYADKDWAATAGLRFTFR